jgi:uncharacterized protein (TIGR02271 family)
MNTDYNYGDYVTLQPGMDVYASDGDKVGSISTVTDTSITVEKGFFFPKDYIIPISAIEGVDERDRVYLRIAKDAALREEWTGWETDTTRGTTDRKGTTRTTDTDSTRVPVYEEQLDASKHQVSRGAVRIQKEVVTEDRTISVPVTEERVRITRVDSDTPVTGNVDDVFEDEVIEIPLTGEEVDVNKTTRQTGEVVVDKEKVQRDQQVSGKVRREEVHVDDKNIDENERRRRHG